MVCQFYLSFQRTSFWLCWFFLWSPLFLLHLFRPWFLSFISFSLPWGSFLPFLVTLGVELGYLFDFFLASWGKPVLLWTFPLALLLQCPIAFRLFLFSFISMHILISFFISSMICWLFRSLLFSLHMLIFLIVFFSCSWYLILLHCDQKRHLEWFQCFLIYQG